MSDLLKSKIGRIAMGGILGFILLSALGIFAYVGYLDWMDKENYQKGHQAYVQADCQTAVSYLSKVSAESNKYAQLAHQEISECGLLQDALDLENTGNADSALSAFVDFIVTRNASPLTQTAREHIAGLFQSRKYENLASDQTCTMIQTMLGGNLIPDPDTHLPSFYLACGLMYDGKEQYDYSFAFFQWVLTSYPSSPAATRAETAILINPVSCTEIDTLRQSVIANRVDFMPRLYNTCGLVYELLGDFVSAINMYETFIAEYPDHALAAEVETALARTIVNQAQNMSAGEIVQPEPSGTTTSGSVKIVLQNDSPDKLRITFSGSASRVEEIEPCQNCIVYNPGFEPAYCPELGPLVEYTLPPGEYTVVVESISDTTVIPWLGTWTLSDGMQYYRCFLLTDGSD